MSAMALSGAELAVESGRIVAGDRAFDIRPRQFRRMLLTMENSVQGRIPQIRRARGGAHLEWLEH